MPGPTDYGAPRTGDHIRIDHNRSGSAPAHIYLLSSTVPYSKDRLWLYYSPLNAPYVRLAGVMSEDISIVFRPGDPIDEPDWAGVGRVHDWRNYIGEEVAEIWSTFSRAQKVALFRSAERRADLEEWD